MILDHCVYPNFLLVQHRARISLTTSALSGNFSYRHCLNPDLFKPIRTNRRLAEIRECVHYQSNAIAVGAQQP